MPKIQKNSYPVDKKYDSIVSFFDKDEKHLQTCRKILGSNYKEIKTMGDLRRSISLVNDFLDPLIETYEDPASVLLQASQKANAKHYLKTLININQSLKTLKGMLETLPDSPVGKKIKQVNFVISKDFERERDKIHFFDSILLQNANKLAELQSVIHDYRTDIKKVFKILKDVQNSLRMICLAYEDRWRSMKKLLEFHFSTSIS